MDFLDSVCLLDSVQSNCNKYILWCHTDNDINMDFSPVTISEPENVKDKENSIIYTDAVYFNDFNDSNKRTLLNMGIKNVKVVSFLNEKYRLLKETFPLYLYENIQNEFNHPREQNTHYRNENSMRDMTLIFILLALFALIKYKVNR